MSLAVLDIKAFVPAQNIETSKEFYEALGFEVPWSSGDTAYVRHGQVGFLLLESFIPDHANNFMMHLQVESVGDWYANVLASGVVKKFGIELGKLQDELREFSLTDPAGVCWLINQNNN